MNSLKQRSLQICNWISEAQCAKWGRIRKATPADFTDGVTLRAMRANEYIASLYRWLRGSGFVCPQQNRGQNENPSESAGVPPSHLCLPSAFD